MPWPSGPDDEDLSVGEDAVYVEDKDFDIFCARFSCHLKMIARLTLRYDCRLWKALAIVFDGAFIETNRCTREGLQDFPLGEMPDVKHHLPHVVVREVAFRRRHAGRVDAVFDDPL